MRVHIVLQQSLLNISVLLPVSAGISEYLAMMFTAFHAADIVCRLLISTFRDSRITCSQR
mgnify:CR=1 FL=1